MFELFLATVSFFLILSWVLISNSLINAVCLIIYLFIVYKIGKKLDSP